MSDWLEGIPKEWRPRIIRTAADRLAAGMVAILIDRPLMRHEFSPVLKAASAHAPEGVSEKDVLDALDRLTVRLKRKGGIPSNKQQPRRSRR
jgi:hypothetical protein